MDHKPVLADEVASFLLPALGHGGLLLDATLGRGGHARLLLERASSFHLLGIDRDPEAVAEGGTNLGPFQGRVRVVRGDFEELASLLERLGPAEVRGVLFDLGVSSPQLDAARRGFSFRGDGPLDMRMDPDQLLSAADVVNSYPVADLERVIKTYGEERFARRVAQAIVRSRPVRSTSVLADIVKEAIPAATRRTGGHPARRTFQALRIEVNRELDALEVALPDAIESLSIGGRAVVISYHSLEDRIVKRTFAAEANDCVCPPDLPVCACGAQARVRILTRRPVRPGSQEVADNPRAASARLRAVERVGTLTKEGAP